jgi:hypothetical protein
MTRFRIVVDFLIVLLLAAACATSNRGRWEHPRELSFLAANRFPSDAVDGSGEARRIWAGVRSESARAYVAASAGRLALEAADKRLDPGLWALVRAEVDHDPEYTASPEIFAASFEVEWAAVAALIDGLPPSQSLSEALFRRVRIEQFGRTSAVAFWRAFPDDAASQAAWARIWPKVQAADQANTAYLQQVLRDRDWLDDFQDGAGAEEYAWLIVQHSDQDRDFQRAMLARLEPFVGSRVRAQDFALLWDRVAAAEGRPQRYGSQLRCEHGEMVATGGVESPELLDARRAEMGLQAWSEYRDFVQTETRCARTAVPGNTW